MTDYRNTIRKNAARLRELHAAIGETFCLQPRGEAHHAACAAFHAAYDALAFPGGLGANMLKVLILEIQTS